MDKSSVVLTVNAGSPHEEAEPVAMKAEEGDPFRILIVGDFSGSETRQPLASRRPMRVDRDNFDQAMRKLGAGVEALSLGFAELADFEPDSIFRRCHAFQTASAERPAEAAAPPRPAASSLESDVERLTSGSLLDDILNQTEPAPPTGARPAARTRPRSELQSLVERIVTPHLAPRETQQQLDARQRTEQARQALMRAILHHPKVQALEAAWRGLDLVVRSLDSDEGLSIYILDLSKSEAAADLANGRGLLSRVLVEETVRTPGGHPWAVILGNYSFGRSKADVAMLASLATLARSAGAAFIAEAEPPGDSASAEWEALRAQPEAAWIGLAVPRFIGRLPYGNATYAIDSFPFEEIEGVPNHADFLWVNPAFACGLLLGRSFNESGWRFRPRNDREISGMPYFTFDRAGETEAQPCAEVLLTDSQIEALQEEGLMSLASIKNRDAVFLMGFQSIAKPLCRLAGRWL